MTNKQGATVKDVVERIDMGDDVEFECNGKKYTILGWTDGGPEVAEQMTGANDQQFKDGQDLVSRYMIDGVKMIDHFPHIRFL